MTRLYEPTYSSDDDDAYARLVTQETNGTDPMLLIKSMNLPEDALSHLTLAMDAGPLPDYMMMMSMIGAVLFSSRIATVISDFAGNHVQWVKAPLRRAFTHEPVFDYAFLNSTQSFDCADFNKSKIDFDATQPTRVEFVHTWAFNPDKMPSDVHVFRPLEFPFVVFFSEPLAMRLLSIGDLKDLAFYRHGEGRPVKVGSSRRGPTHPV